MQTIKKVMVVHNINKGDVQRFNKYFLSIKSIISAARDLNMNCSTESNKSVYGIMNSMTIYDEKYQRRIFWSSTCYSGRTKTLLFMNEYLIS